MNFGLFFSYLLPGIVFGMMLVFAVREERTSRKRKAAAARARHEHPVAQIARAPRGTAAHPAVVKNRRKLYIHDLNSAA